ncbi:hypothetical protein [Streptomyces sp. NPDC046909]|uniref:hypothetical protein n=1 Tax=Streptomyces sp. NPDC046909 TaxID=3155617 RepID=UPI003401932E
MNHPARDVRSNEDLDTGDGRGVWPAATRAVTRIGRACVIEGLADFGPDDLNLVRGLFPARHVTLDGDVITVWPPPRP